MTGYVSYSLTPHTYFGSASTIMEGKPSMWVISVDASGSNLMEFYSYWYTVNVNLPTVLDLW